MTDILELDFSRNSKASGPHQVGRGTQRLAGLLVSIVGLALTVACKPKPNPTKPAPSNSAQPSGSAAASASAVPRRSFVVPAGPAFAIEAGIGAGPVRFGATVATLERLMEGKCDELTDKFCRYIKAGVEYELKDGVVSGIVVYRHDRPVEGSPGKFWGRTRFAIAPDVTPRVVAGYAHSVLGKPESSETLDGKNPNRTVLREQYPGLVLEFDRGEYTKELILGSIRVLKLDDPPKPKAIVKPKGPPEPLH
jgi:hypothetical protein